MAQAERLICRSEDIAERGPGVRFAVPQGSGEAPAFAVRFRGRVYAYVNRCPHRGVELDWVAGEFFDLSGIYLICSTHGALYEPDSGRCAGGPCHGAALESLPVEERNGMVWTVEQLK